MKEYLEFFSREWYKVGISWGLMGFILAVALYFSGLISAVVAVGFLIACAYPMHQFEEYVYPGGFMKMLTQEFFRLKNIEAIMDHRGVFMINIPLIWIFLPVLAFLTILDSSLLSALGVFSFIAGFAHVATSFKIKRLYNPGLFISCLLNIPLGILSFFLIDQIHTLALTVLFFWISFVLWGVRMGARYKKTKDPHYDAQLKEIGWLFLLAIVFYIVTFMVLGPTLF